MGVFSLGNWFPSLLPRRSREVLFAEALSQALNAGLEVSAALLAAADVMPGAKLRRSIREMSRFCRQGDSLAHALERTMVPVSGELLAALLVAADRRSLARHLAEFARERSARAGELLAVVAHRPVSTRRFAASLSRLLQDQRLTPQLLIDAARLADGETSRLTRAARQVATDLEDGQPLADAFRRQSRQFDRFFCSLVAVPDQRGALREVLQRLAGEAVPCEVRQNGSGVAGFAGRSTSR